MGFRTSSARRSSAQSAVASSIVVLPDTTGTGPTLSGSGISANTTINKQIITVGQTTTQGTTVLSGLTVSNVYVTDSSFNLIDDTALDPAGGYLKIIGNGFKTGCAVYINGSSVTTTFISSTELRVTTPATTAGTYNLMVFNTDGNGAIYLNLSVSNMPAYTTSAGSLGTVYETNPYTQSVVATGDAPLVYSLYSGTLPPNATLAANGVISGTSPVENSSNTYSFVVNVKDAQNQDTTRSFSLTINTDVVTWSSPANNTTYSLIGGGPMANVTLAATSAAGKTITYTANTLPTGVSLSGNTIYGTPNTAQTVYTELTATAATTNRNAKRYISWSVVLGDPQFYLTSLLLNGETAVTPFINDAGPNSLAPVISGDTRADRFSPYTDGYYSHYFNGSTYYYLNNQLALGAGDFTLEMWCFFSDVTNAQNIFEGRPNGSNGAYPTIYIQSGTLRYFTASGDRITSSTLVTNRWYHIAVVRSSGVTKMYINGTQDGVSYTDSATYLTGASRPLIASYNGSAGNFTGYISNLRVVVGTAVYSTSFTPSTTPLTTVANTQLMVCGTNRVIDLSTNAFTLTTAGTPFVTTVSPFTLSSSYSTYGSGYFDGTGDYLTLSPTINIGTNDLTVEAWVYRTSTTTLQTFFSLNSYTSGILLRWETTVFGLYVGGTGYSIAIPNSNGMPINQWSHVALVRQSGVFKLYVNGTQVYSFSSTYALYINSIMIGRSIHSSTELWNGYISDARVVANTAVYTSNTAPPAIPLTAIANTALLTLQTNGPARNSEIVDNSSFNNPITRLGNASVGSFSPYSQTGWSNSFTGSDYLSVTSASGQMDATGDFTMELWIYWHTMPTTGYQNICGNGNISGTYGLMVGNAAQNSWTAPYVFKLNQASVGDYINGNTTIVAGQWYHLAHTRTSGVNRLFVNGVLQTNTATETTSRPYGTNGTFLIGQNSNCIISNLRYIKGTSLYTATFTPSTTPLTAVANTQLLICQSNRFKDSSNNNLAVTTSGSPTVQAVSPFAPTGGAYSPTTNGGSLYCLNTSSYLNTTFPGQVFGTGDFTVECWVYATAASHNFSLCSTTTNAWGLITYLNNVYWQFNGANVQSSSALLPLNCWSHIAVSRVSGVTKGFINGAQVFSAADTNNYSATPTRGIGANGGTAGQYISDFRVTVGTGLYTTAFTPPTSALTASNNTTMLLSFNNAAVNDAHSSTVCETTGNAQLSTTIKKFGKSSIYFDGTSGRLMVPASPLYMFGTADFTVEFWMNTSDTSFGLINPSSTTGAGYWAILVAGSTLYWQSAYNVTNLKTASLSGYLNNTWVHIAIVRSSGVLNFYFNGTVQGTGTSDTTNYNGTNNGLYIGHDTQNNGYFAGYLDDIRITKGYARYTTNFTAPTAAFVGQ